MVGPGSPVVSTWIAFLYWPALFIRLARLAFTSRVILSCVNFRLFRLSSCRISFSCDFSPQSHYEITSLFVNLLDYCIHYNSYYNTPLAQLSSHVKEMMMADWASFSVWSYGERLHAYKDIWTAVHGEELLCQMEDGNRINAFAVAVLKGKIVIGHVPEKTFALCTYVHQDGLIVCRVTCPRHYSGGLVRGKI